MHVSTVAIFEKSLGDLALTDNLRGLIHTLPTGHRCGSRLSFVESITGKGRYLLSYFKRFPVSVCREAQMGVPY